MCTPPGLCANDGHLAFNLTTIKYFDEHHPLEVGSAVRNIPRIDITYHRFTPEARENVFIKSKHKMCWHVQELSLKSHSALIFLKHVTII